MDYLATLSKHTQAVNVVRWAPKGEPIPSPSAIGVSSVNKNQASSWHRPATTEMSSYGSAQKRTTRPLAPRASMTRRHGGQSTCVGRLGRKYTISHGRRMPPFSSLEVWTMLRGSTMLGQVGKFLGSLSRKRFADRMLQALLCARSPNTATTSRASPGTR